MRRPQCYRHSSLFENHAGTNLAQVQIGAVTDWTVERPSSNIPVTTIKNIINAVIEAGGWFPFSVGAQRPLKCSRPSENCSSYRPTSSYTTSQQDGTPLMTWLGRYLEQQADVYSINRQEKVYQRHRQLV